MAFEARVACEADAAEIAALVNRAYRPAAGKGGWTHETHLVSGPRTTTAQITSLLRTQPTILLLCTASRIAACVHVQHGEHACADIGMLATDPESQGKGLGSDMLRQAEAYAIHHLMATNLRLSVLSSRSELLTFYERRGYVLAGKTSEYPTSAGIGTPIAEGLQVLSLMKRP